MSSNVDWPNAWELPRLTDLDLLDAAVGEHVEVEDAVAVLRVGFLRAAGASPRSRHVVVLSWWKRAYQCDDIHHLENREGRKDYSESNRRQEETQVAHRRRKYGLQTNMWTKYEKSWGAGFCFDADVSPPPEQKNLRKALTVAVK